MEELPETIHTITVRMLPQAQQGIRVPLEMEVQETQGTVMNLLEAEEDSQEMEPLEVLLAEEHHLSTAD